MQSIPCPAILKSGANQGEPCGRAVSARKGCQYHGYPKNYDVLMAELKPRSEAPQYVQQQQPPYVQLQQPQYIQLQNQHQPLKTPATQPLHVIAQYPEEESKEHPVNGKIIKKQLDDDDLGLTPKEIEKLESELKGFSFETKPTNKSSFLKSVSDLLLKAKKLTENQQKLNKEFKKQQEIITSEWNSLNDLFLRLLLE